MARLLCLAVLSAVLFVSSTSAFDGFRTWNDVDFQGTVGDPPAEVALSGSCFDAPPEVDNQISSLKIKACYRFWEFPNCMGASVIMRGEFPDLSEVHSADGTNWDNRISSATKVPCPPPSAFQYPKKNQGPVE